MTVRLISYSSLAPLRLRQFIPSERRIVEHGGFEWMGGLWIYEGIAFTWFGRLEGAPEITAGLELNFEELEQSTLQRILAAVELPVTSGMNSSELESVLGQRYVTQIFAADRQTYVFRLGDSDPYEVSCTIHEDQGLIHVSLIRNDVRRRLAVA
jgi:hypothetical protein